MRALVDTNILSSLAHPAHPKHAIVLEALGILARHRHPACIVPQNVYEFWVVCSRPREQNGFGLTTVQIQAELSKISKLFLFLRDERAIYPHWMRLVVEHDVKGKLAHDARLVAAALPHDCTHVLTLNDHDLKRFTEVISFTPEAAQSVLDSLTARGVSASDDLST